VVLAREFAERLTNFVVACVLRNAQRLVIISELNSHWVWKRSAHLSNSANSRSSFLHTRLFPVSVIRRMEGLKLSFYCAGNWQTIGTVRWSSYADWGRALERVWSRLVRAIAGRHSDRTRQFHFLFSDNHLCHHQHHTDSTSLVLSSVIIA